MVIVIDKYVQLMCDTFDRPLLKLRNKYVLNAYQYYLNTHACLTLKVQLHRAMCTCERYGQRQYILPKLY